MRVRIHYHRPPDRTEIFENELIHSADDVIVTSMVASTLKRPLIVNGRTALENGSPMIWFTFPGADYDVARFHNRDGEFTGIYVNILTPVEFVTEYEWNTTDLFLDVWIDRDGSVHVLDEDELQHAVVQGWISHEAAEGARAAAHRIVAEHRDGTWPPRIVYDWPDMDRAAQLR